MSTNKTDLIENIARETGLNKTKAKEALDAMLNTISGELSSGGKISLTGFGSFQVRERKARKGRNPQTGEEIAIPAGRAVRFVPGKALTDIVS